MKYKGVMNTTQSNSDRPRRRGHKDFRISVDSIREIKLGLKKLTNHVSDDLGWEWEGANGGEPKVLRPMHIANALFTWFLGLPEPAKTAVMRNGLKLYVERLDGDPAAPFASPAVREIRARGVGGYVIDDRNGEPPKSKGKDLSAGD